jgi:hypothetical protein
MPKWPQLYYPVFRVIPIMEKAKLAQWLKKQVQSIRKNASDVHPAFFPGTIHQLRTETKALRAMIRLIHHDTSGQPGLPKSFRRLYRAAGDIRDRQVQLQYLTTDKRHTLPAFAVWLAHKTGDAARDWDHQYRKPALRKLEDDIAHMQLPQPDLRALLNYYNDRLGKMKELAANDPDDDTLHEVRKQAKDMQHVLRYCEKEWPEAWLLIQPLENGLERLSDKAGAYNDRRNLLHALDQFMIDYKEQLDEKQRAAVGHAAEDWDLSKARARKALLTAIRQISRKTLKLRAPRPLVA